MPRRNTGGGKSSRESRRGRDNAANMSRSVKTPIDSSPANAVTFNPASRSASGTRGGPAATSETVASETDAASAVGSVAVGSVAVGSVAVGSVAVGSVAVGSVAATVGSVAATVGSVAGLSTASCSETALSGGGESGEDGSSGDGVEAVGVVSAASGATPPPKTDTPAVDSWAEVATVGILRAGVTSNARSASLLPMRSSNRRAAS